MGGVILGRCAGSHSNYGMRSILIGIAVFLILMLLWSLHGPIEVVIKRGQEMEIVGFQGPGEKSVQDRCFLFFF